MDLLGPCLANWQPFERRLIDFRGLTMCQWVRACGGEATGNAGLPGSGGSGCVCVCGCVGWQRWNHAQLVSWHASHLCLLVLNRDAGCYVSHAGTCCSARRHSMHAQERDMQARLMLVSTHQYTHSLSLPISFSLSVSLSLSLCISFRVPTYPLFSISHC